MIGKSSFFLLLIAVAVVITSSFLFINKNKKETSNQSTFDFEIQNYKLSGTTQFDVPSISDKRLRASTILVNKPNASDTQYYLVGAMVLDNNIIYSTPVLLGNKITISSLKTSDGDNGQITVTFLTRAEGATLSDTPTVEVTKNYTFSENGSLVEKKTK